MPGRTEQADDALERLGPRGQWPVGVCGQVARVEAHTGNGPARFAKTLVEQPVRSRSDQPDKGTHTKETDRCVRLYAYTPGWIVHPSGIGQRGWPDAYDYPELCEVAPVTD